MPVGSRAGKHSFLKTICGSIGFTLPVAGFIASVLFSQRDNAAQAAALFLAFPQAAYGLALVALLSKYPPAEPGALVESRSKRRFAALRGRNPFAA
ncbi:MAG: hypothetical protein H6851_02280 [Geminicoccaceae bacterium]|nr:hypothetical protein [Geminicoccaceae bacterium]